MTPERRPRIRSVEDAKDPRLSDYHALRDRQWRRRAPVFLVESALLVRRLVSESPFRIRSLLVTPAALEGLRDALERVGSGVEVYVGTPALLRQVLGFEFHRGCLALAERGPALEAHGLIEPPGARTVLVLEDVRDPDNVGGLFRDARAFGAEAVLLTPGSGDPLYPKAIRASAGAALTVPFARLPDWPVELDRLHEAGYVLLALTPGGETDLEDVGRTRPLPSRVGLLVGSEGDGLGEAALAASDLRVRIAMAPGADSLNVAVAAGIALHRLVGNTRSGP